VLEAAGRIKRLERSGPCVRSINGSTVIVGGTCWGAEIPALFDPSPYEIAGQKTHGYWVTHHHIRFPCDDTREICDCRAVPGIDVVINGHVHKQYEHVTVGRTTWINPGNIARVQRSDATRAHVPGALRIDISADGWDSQRIDVPHQPFDEVFH